MAIVEKKGYIKIQKKIKKIDNYFEVVLDYLGGIENIAAMYEGKTDKICFIIDSWIYMHKYQTFEEKTFNLFWEIINKEIGNDASFCWGKKETYVIVKDVEKTKKRYFLKLEANKVEDTLLYSSKRESGIIVLPKKISFYNYIKEELLKQPKRKLKENIVYKNFYRNRMEILRNGNR